MKKKQITKPWTTFDQIKGYEDEVQRLKTISQALVGSADFDIFPKGIMLSGIPGTGKTSLAKAFIGATGFPCYSVDFCSLHLLSKVYEKARKHAPSIVFLDDVDRVIATTGPEGFISDESRSCLKELLSRLDGVEDSSGVITVMTTNEYYSLDEAIRRSGRIDLHIPIDRPNDADCVKILGFYMAQHPDFYPSDDEKLVETLAQKCHGLSCADIKSVVKDVYLLNYYRVINGDGIDFGEAFQTKIMELTGGGLLKRIFKSEKDALRICYHEAGHALADWVFCGKSSDVCCLQTANESAAGWTSPRMQDSEVKFFTGKGCRNEMAACMAGAAAEKVFMGEISIGVASDIEQAKQFARTLLGCCLTGSFHTLSAVLPIKNVYSDDDRQTEQYTRYIQTEEQRMIERDYERAVDLLKHHTDAVEEIVAILKTNGILAAEKLEAIFVKHNIAKGGDNQ